jgi:hypothetical protein
VLTDEQVIEILQWAKEFVAKVEVFLISKLDDREHELDDN